MEQDLLQRLGERIRELRLQRGWSQERMAEIGSIHRTYQQHLESGKRDARFTSLVRLAKALDVSLSQLFEGLEAGEPLPKRRASPSALDRDKLKAELATLERTVENLRALAVEPQPMTGRNRKQSRSKMGK